MQSGEAILISNLDENLEWRETPLLTALRAKSLICLPIKIDKRTVAAMLAVSPEPIPAFTDEDRQVYHQIGRQTSVILQNISLLNETRKRLAGSEPPARFQPPIARAGCGTDRPGIARKRTPRPACRTCGRCTDLG